jgi:hypothetical protein
MKTLEFLQSIQTNPYPNSKTHVNPPLEFNLEIHERVPTAEEFSDMIYVLNEPSFMEFVDTHKCTAHPTSARALHDLGLKDPSALVWPLLIDRERRKICIGTGVGKGSVSIRRLLQDLVRERDGKSPPAAPPSPPPRPEKKPEWIDYD